MGDAGACWDNTVIERFFGSLKHDWLLKVPQPTREHIANADLSPVEYDQNSLRKSPDLVAQNK